MCQMVCQMVFQWLERESSKCIWQRLSTLYDNVLYNEQWVSIKRFTGTEVKVVRRICWWRWCVLFVLICFIFFVLLFTYNHRIIFSKFQLHILLPICTTQSSLLSSALRTFPPQALKSHVKIHSSWKSRTLSGLLSMLIQFS